MRILAAAAVSIAAATPLAAQTAAERLGIYAPSERPGNTLPINGVEIFNASAGVGPTVVLLHGYPLSGALFERVREHLEPDHRVVTIDHRGYGQSTTDGPVDSVVTYAEDALALLAELEIDDAVIGGMSMGGPILFEMYRQNPDIFRGAMLIDTNHLPAGEIETGIWNGARAALEQSGEVSSIIPFLMPMMLTGETRFEDAPAQVDYLTQVMEQASLDGALGGATALAERPDSTETLRSMDVPVLVLVGRADPVYPVELAREMADLAPQGELVVIEDASHAAVFEQPEAAGEAMAAFLARID